MTSIELKNSDLIKSKINAFKDASYHDLINSIIKKTDTKNYENIVPQSLIEPQFSVETKLTDIKNRFNECLTHIETFIMDIEKADASANITYSDNTITTQEPEYTNPVKPSQNNYDTSIDTNANNNDTANLYNNASSIIFEEQLPDISDGDNMSNDSLTMGNVLGVFNSNEGFTDIYDKNGKVIGELSPGEYPVYKIQYDNNGNAVSVCISQDGEEEQWIKITPENAGSLLTTNSILGTYVTTNALTVILDENGTPVAISDKQEFFVYEVRYDSNGKPTEIRITPDNTEEQWIKINNDTDPNILFTATNILGIYTLIKTSTEIFDNKGNLIGTIASGDYVVYEIKWDTKGNIVAIRISPNGEKEQWIHIDPNDSNAGVFIAENQIGIYTLSDGTINIYDKENTIIGTLNQGTYRVYQVKYDSNGHVNAVRISPNGEKEQWIHINYNNSKTGTYTANGQIGVYTINKDFNIYDNNGKVIGHANKGTYNIYAVKRDINGNIIAIRISPDGESEQWIRCYDIIYSNKNHTQMEETIITYSSINDQHHKINENCSVVVYKNKKNNPLGIIGVLVIAGAILLRLKTKDNKTKNIKVNPGKYKLYDILEDENGNITQARVNDKDDEECWIEF